MNIPQKLKKSLISLKKRDPENWRERYRLSSKRLLSSLFFFASAKTVYQKGNRLLSAIGYYYSLFHISKALLFLLPHYEIEQLKGLSHRKVLKMIENDFVQRKMLPAIFLVVLDYTKQIREAVNYNQDSWVSLYKVLKDNESNVIKCIEDGIVLFKELCKENLMTISTLIGDGIGDDWTDSYLSEEEENLVWQILGEHELTT